MSDDDLHILRDSLGLSGARARRALAFTAMDDWSKGPVPVEKRLSLRLGKLLGIEKDFVDFLTAYMRYRASRAHGNLNREVRLNSKNKCLLEICDRKPSGLRQTDEVVRLPDTTPLRQMAIVLGHATEHRLRITATLIAHIEWLMARECGVGHWTTLQNDYIRQRGAQSARAKVTV